MANPSLKYYTLGGEAPKSVPSATVIDDAFNPLIGYPQEFIDSVTNINQLDLAHAVPYIKLVLVDLNGNDVKDYTQDIFFKHPNLSQPFPADVRYPNRPLASLIGVEVKQDLGGGTGYIYFSHVTIKMRIHKIDALENSPLKAFLFTGLPFKLTYGWNSPKNDFLNSKDTLVFNVQTYDLSFSETNEIDFTVFGTAYRNDFLNINLGDDGLIQAEGVKEDKDDISAFLEYINSDTTSLLNVKKRFGQTTEDRSQVLQPFRERFLGKLKGFFDDKKITQVPQKFGKQSVKCVYLHSIIEKIAADTITVLGSKVGGINEVRFVYGDFNENAGINYANQSIADFLIPTEELKTILNKELEVKIVMTLGDLLSILNNHFLKEKIYYRVGQDEDKNESFSMPDIKWVVNTVKESNKDDAQTFFDIYLFDTDRNIPSTISVNEELGEQAPAGQIEEKMRSKGIPIIRYGHTNSFISNLKISTNMDSAMRSIYMSRIYEKLVGSPRSTTVKDDQHKNNGPFPVTLPLQGSLSVIGCTQWKPFKVFFLSNGVYLFDNIYNITSVTHRIDDNGFDTDLEFKPSS